MTNSIGRETNVAVVIDKFGFDSAETRGVLTVFIIGTVIERYTSVFCHVYVYQFYHFIHMHLQWQQG